MRKRFTDTEAWKILRTAIEILLIAAIIFGLIELYKSFGFAEDYEITYDAWIFCTPGDYVNIRPNPSKKGDAIGRAECGYLLHLDGKEKNGYVHCIYLGLEMSEGWVHKGYVVYDEPRYVNATATVVSKGRLAARKYVDGRRTKWLKPQATVRVWYVSSEWCVTNMGYVQTEYLRMEGE